MRIAIDIDSTLHPYWDQFAVAAKRRFGIDLPYADQVTWSIDRLRPEQVGACVRETHREEQILAAKPYPGAVQAVRDWHQGGHYILITSHRAADCDAVTARWLDAIGLPYDLLHCSDDKVPHCVEQGIDLLVDDSPVNLDAALDRGIAVATLLHPWNADFCESESVICAEDWPTLTARLALLLARDGAAGVRPVGADVVADGQPPARP